MEFELVKPMRIRPYNEIDKFPLWAKKCIKKYISSGTLQQVFKVSHAAMIYEFLWARGVRPQEGWLLDSAKSVLSSLEKFDANENSEEANHLDEDILANILCIREYFVINDCHDPNTCVTSIEKKWTEPDHPPRHYLNQLHVLIETMY